MLLLFIIPLALTINASEIKNNASGLVVVIHVTNNAKEAPTLTKQQIRHIFMGGRLSRKYKAINWPIDHQLRMVFNTSMIGLTKSRIQSYWAQMRFSGRSKPPLEADSLEEILAFLIETENSVSYLPAGTKIPGQLKIVYP